MTNNGLSRFAHSMFFRPGYQFDGWRIRFRIDTKWFWYLENGTYVLVDEYNEQNHPQIQKFAEHDRIPYIPVNGIASMQAEICWKEADSQYSLSYYSNYKATQTDCHFDNNLFHICTTGRGFTECFLQEPMKNDGRHSVVETVFSRSGYEFSGWYLRLKFNGQWYWYLEDGTWKLCSDYQNDSAPARYLLTKGSNIPCLTANHIEQVRLDAVWDAEFTTKIKQRIKKLLP